MSLPLILVLIAAFVSASGALLVKRAAELGAGVWRTAFVANLLCGFAFQPLWLLGGTLHPALWWQPVVVALLFVVGQWLTFIALDRGDVSVAIPVMGIKILIVAVLVTLFAGVALRWQLWTAAVCATVGIGLLNGSGGRAAHHHVARTIVMAALAAAAYACFDVLVQRWSPRWGLGRFLPITMGLSALLSFVFVTQFRAPLRALPTAAWPWLLGGTLALAIQSVLFVSTIAQWGQAAPANVVYSSRGMWSVLLVGIVGHWVSSREQHLGRRILLWRLAGALCMTSAIALVVLG